MRKLTKKLKFVMSNFYHTIPHGMAKALKEDRAAHAQYAGMNFNGCVHAVDGGFACEVMQYGKHAATVVSPNLKQLMTDVSNRFGWS